MLSPQQTVEEFLRRAAGGWNTEASRRAFAILKEPAESAEHVFNVRLAGTEQHGLLLVGSRGLTVFRISTVHEVMRSDYGRLTNGTVEETQEIATGSGVSTQGQHYLMFFHPALDQLTVDLRYESHEEVTAIRAVFLRMAGEPEKMV